MTDHQIFVEVSTGNACHSIKIQVAEAERSLFNYIEVYYNRRRKHSTNGYKSPAHYECELWNKRKAA